MHVINNDPIQACRSAPRSASLPTRGAHRSLYPRCMRRFIRIHHYLTSRTTSTVAMPKRPISALPLPPDHLLLTKNLTPDAEIPNPPRFLEILKEKPSVQRRSRAISAQSHFSFTSPLPVQFPYRLQPPDPLPTDEERLNYIERKLAELEPLEERPLSPAVHDSPYRKFVSNNRDPERVLIGLSEAGLRDCVPGLDVGDAFSIIGKPSLLPSGDESGPAAATDSEGIPPRQELVDVLSGQSMLVPFDRDGNPMSGSWSLRYSGHQFGNWAGQLGDGRAISICKPKHRSHISHSISFFQLSVATSHPDDPELVTEIQLKGVGRTPYSRNADGLAVTRSSIREFLAAEGMKTDHCMVLVIIKPSFHQLCTRWESRPPVH